MSTKLLRLKLLLNIVFQCLILICLSTSSLNSQTKANYKIHTVTSGETFKSIAEVYHLNAEELADYNNLDYYDGPLVSKTLRMPVKLIKAVPKKEVVIKESLPEKEVAIKNLSTEKKVKSDVVPEPVKKSETPHKVIVTPEIHPSYNKPSVEEGKDNMEQSPASANDANGSTTKKNTLPSFKDIFPLLIFLTISIVLLVTGVYWYRSSFRR